MIFTQIEKDIAKQMFKIGFIIVFLIVFLSITIGVIDRITSEKGISIIDDSQKKVEVIKPIAKPVVKQELPLFLEIPEYGISTTVEAPVIADVGILDAALLKGAVYYPGSGLPGSNNTLIFGHSTGWAVVRNKAYQVFNDIKSVKPGTIIYVRTQTQVHMYKTREVSRVSKYTSWIQFKSDSPILTLATCDSFGKASDRWVLVADYIGVK